MQAALDSTALMLGKDLTDGTITPAQVSAKATAYFNALYTNTDAKSVVVGATYTAATGSGSTILLSGSGNINTDFMRVAGFPTLGFDTTSTAAWGNVRMRVAMVLDNTGSMADDGKMPAMQTAAKSLIDQLSALAKNPGDIYISVVPFAKDVNFGTSYYNQTYMDWSLLGHHQRHLGYVQQLELHDQEHLRSRNGKVWTPDHTKWTGCVTDRTQDYDTKNTVPSAGNAPTMVIPEEYVSGSTKYCKTGSSTYLQPIVPLSYDWAALKTAIGNMMPTGNTNQGIGMAWGWLTLGQGAPFNAPAKDPNYTYKEAIILLSDGLNTQNRWSSNAAQIDARQKILCANAKAADITIYTIQVNTGTPAIRPRPCCKIAPAVVDKFYLVKSANQTLTVFNSIGTSLSKLRVSR